MCEFIEPSEEWAIPDVGIVSLGTMVDWVTETTGSKGDKGDSYTTTPTVSSTGGGGKEKEKEL